MRAPDEKLDFDILPSYILALEVLLRVLSPGFEHHVDGILEILPRFFLRPALGDRAGDLRARGDDPAVFSVLVDRGKSLHAQLSPCSSPTRFAGSTSSAFASFRIVEVNAGLPCSMRWMVFLCTPDTSLRSDIDITLSLRNSCSRSTLTSMLHGLPISAQSYNNLCLRIA